MEGPQVFGEIVIQLREAPFLDLLDRDLIVFFRSGFAAFGIRLRLQGEAAFLARLDAEELAGDLGAVVMQPDDLIGEFLPHHRYTAAVEFLEVGDDKVAGLGLALHRIDHRLARLQVLEGALDILFRGRVDRPLDRHALKSADLEIGPDVEMESEGQPLVLVPGEILDVRGIEIVEAVLLEKLIDGLTDIDIKHIGFNAFTEHLFDKPGGDMALAESLETNIFHGVGIFLVQLGLDVGGGHGKGDDPVPVGLCGDLVLHLLFSL